jgi:glycosyltransferase involved in cell wall biosynthesis
MTKILVHSNAPFVRTGYGVQCAQLVDRLKADGHDPAVSSTYGQQGAVGTWHDTTVYPCGLEMHGNDVIHNHALHHFGGDELAGWIIPLLDVWCLVNPLLADFNVAAWTPVDHFPVPPAVLKFFHRTGATPIAMSRFGERLLAAAGLDPVYIPLAVDTKVYKPSPKVTIGDRTVTGRQMLGVPDDAVLVGMCAMNKDPGDRKGFNEAFRAFAVFWQKHQDAVLYVHSEWSGAAGALNLKELATQAGIPPHAIVFPDSYAYFPHGFSPEQMAAMYSAFDVLLAPSHGEGFCVPLIEAQACGTPVIATDFSAQPELVGAGWLVSGEPRWDEPQRASYVCPSIVDIVMKLEAAHAAREDVVEWQRLKDRAVAFAAGYDADVVFETYWRPFLASLEPAEPEPVPYVREPMGEVAVIVPAMRAENLPRLIESFEATNDGTASLYCVVDDSFGEGSKAGIPNQVFGYPAVLTGQETSTFAEKVNAGFEMTKEPWVLLVGDDCEFKGGWIEAARDQSYRFDVVGTNDSSGPVKNPDVAAGRHADHFFVRRSYVDALGACLDGPGVLAPDCYRHWFVDKEIVGLAKARRVFTPCHDSIIEHHHPGYEGREDLRRADPVYMAAVEHSGEDERTWLDRRPLIEMQRVSRAKVR